ncbi:hypothetical protein CAPTEDRAFT_168548 [Capitella teleta]|uniref:Protein arginine N-methyltransferase n=1 Tax=Capitella teleta TaxID=283909 RepID=R7T3H4_CAPTE|nr:hypothetical protein CAPTEDRAFT_168548 [Capitella teleta]|eukprot:ELT87312.1 hypothetical protein CAPTEDRAFT_168548 [Capitella teleta]
MTSFVSRISPVTGKTEWVTQDEDYDYQQEVARSAYADMLHDTERNQKYLLGLKAAIQRMHQKGKAASVLDIGTGTGLLSMMAVTCGADLVTACEAFKPMADCARKIISDNGMTDRIHLIPKRSTDLTVGPDGDMKERANILVTEVFDTELIGEGGIGTFAHAHKCLLEDDCIVVPTAANMYIQPVQSKLVKDWSQLQPISLPGNREVVPPPDLVKCSAASTVHDIQMDQIPASEFTSLADPVKVFRFDYSGKSAILKKNQSKSKVKATASGSCEAFFMWWDIEMDVDSTIVLSCAPKWSHPNPQEMQWRDHWMQAVYFPSSDVSVEKGEDFDIHSSHDEYSLWFDVAKSDENPSGCPAHSFGAHTMCGRARVGLMNDAKRNEKFANILNKHVNRNTICLSLSDQSLFPLMAAKMGAKQVFSVESQPLARRFVQKYATHNELNVQLIEKSPDSIESSDLNQQMVNLLIAEPYFCNATLPWHSLFFWYARTDLSKHLTPGAVVLPQGASLMAIVVDFEDLWKIRAPVGLCEGFDLSTFDDLIESASDSADAYMEPQPLWEYPGFALTEPFQLNHFDFTKPLTGIKAVERDGFMDFSNDGKLRGVAVWMDYHLDPTTSISTGLLEAPQSKRPLSWDRHSRQGVHLFPRPKSVAADGKNKLHYKFTFKPKSGDMTFAFSLVNA